MLIAAAAGLKKSNGAAWSISDFCRWSPEAASNEPATLEETIAFMRAHVTGAPET